MVICYYLSGNLWSYIVVLKVAHKNKITSAYHKTNCDFLQRQSCFRLATLPLNHSRLLLLRVFGDNPNIHQHFFAIAR